MTARERREFFTVKTVSEALAGFRPERRTAVETRRARRRARARPRRAVAAPHALPGFARATVDGFAVRAADTYGASEGLPSYLDLAGEVHMGRPPELEVRPGTAVAIATGAPLPAGADAVAEGRAHPGADARAARGPAPRHARRGNGARRRGRRARRRARPAGRPLRAQDIGMLAAAGIAEAAVHARPRVSIVSTGDELVPRTDAAPARPGARLLRPRPRRPRARGRRRAQLRRHRARRPRGARRDPARRCPIEGLT